MGRYSYHVSQSPIFTRLFDHNARLRPRADFHALPRGAHAEYLLAIILALFIGHALSSIALIAFGLPLPHTLTPTIAIFASIFTGFGLGVFQVVWVTIMQEQVPADALGRVSSIDMLGR